jgi:transposase
MWIDYTHQIRESSTQLTRQEKEWRGHPIADRIKMLRLLKSQTYRSRRALAGVLGYSERQLQRWWELYQTGGLSALLEQKPRGHRTEQLSEPARTALHQELAQGRIARLKDAQSYLHKHWSIRYHLSGLSRLFKRHQIKLKTGRRRHRRASSAQQAVFKKTSLTP